MTTQEAKEILDDFNKMRRWLIDKTPYSEQIREAINVAIEALKEADNDFFAKAPIKRTLKCKAKIIKTNSMATKFMTLGDSKKGGKKTVFKTFLNSSFTAIKAESQPEDYTNVLFLGHDDGYGDVFKAWSDDQDNFILFFGEKGDEFND